MINLLKNSNDNTGILASNLYTYINSAKGDIQYLTYEYLKNINLTKVSFLSFKYLYGQFANNLGAYYHLIELIDTRRNNNLNY
jgi:hypothetical protein